MTRKYAKRRETTWEYAKGVDGVNKSNHGRLARGAYVADQHNNRVVTLAAG
jgi:hypothetical protein